MIRSLLTRRSIGGAAAALTLALGGASVAWACAQIQPTLTDQSGGATGGSGPSGSRITLIGRNFAPGPVEVHWNSRGGQLLGRTQGPDFSVSVTIPEAAVGVHYIKAYPTTGQIATMAFEVTPSPTAAPRANGSTGTASTASGGTDEEAATSDSTGQSAGAGSATATSGTDNSSGRSDADSSAAQPGAGSVVSAPGGPSAPGATREAAQGSAAAGSGPTAVAERQSRAASANPAVVTTPDGHAVFGGSSAPATAEKPSTATASGDTWSGFAAPAKPSLLSGDVGTSSSAPSSGLGMGIGLLGAGLVALFGGFAAAESARKRALAGAEGR